MNKLFYLALSTVVFGFSMLGCSGSQAEQSKVELTAKAAKTTPTDAAQAEANAQDSVISRPNKILMGYLIDGHQPTAAQFARMTHVSFSFLRAADSTGAIQMTSGWENLDQVVAAAHANGVKAIISFGGGEFVITQSLMGVEEHRQNLIKNIVAFMKKHNFDGFDSDWEPSWLDDKAEMEAVNNVITNHYLDFIKEIREAIDAEFGPGTKTVSAAVMNANSIWYSAEKQISHFPQNNWWDYLDWVALMNYDNDLGAKHATYESVFGPEGSVAYWVGFGVPKKKIVAGVPFYARAGWGAEWLFYKDIIKNDPELATSVDVIKHDANQGAGEKEYGFNGVDLVFKKSKATMSEDLAGIMFWQLAGDLEVEHEKSLLKHMHKAMTEQ